MKAKAFRYLFFTLFHLSVIILTYQFLYQYTKINHFSFVSSFWGLVSPVIWLIITVEFIVTIFLFYKEKQS